MGIGIQKMFAQLLFWLYEFLDSIFEMFRVLCGIDTVEYTENGETVSRSIIEIFLESSAVTKAFLLLFLVSIVVCAISVIVSVVKNTVNMKGGERKAHTKTIGQGFGSIIITFVLGFMMVFGIWGSNQILGQVYLATSDNTSLSISNRLFEMSVTESYVYDYDTPKTRIVQSTDENGNLLWETDPKGNLIVDDKGNYIPIEHEETYFDYLKDDDGNYVMAGGWRNGHTANDIRFGKTTVDEVFGVHKKNLIGLEEKDKEYTTKPMVEIDSFNLLTGYFVVVMVLVALIWSMLGLVKRVFDLVMLFVMLPLISATVPLDEGARLKAWRETVISKVVLAYGAVISVNVFLMVIPIIQGIDFGSIGWSSFGSNLFKMFMLIGGALCINGGQLLIARLFGTSAEESREMAQSARALLGGAAAAGGILHSAKNAVFGGRNKYGRETKGAMQALGKGASVVGNAAGNLLGGQAYRNAAGNIAEKAGNAMQKLRGVGSYKRPGAKGAGGGSGVGDSSATTKQSPSSASSSAGRTPKTKFGRAIQGAGQKLAASARSTFKNGLLGAAGKGAKAVAEGGKDAVDTVRSVAGMAKMFKVTGPFSRSNSGKKGNNNTNNRVQGMANNLLNGSKPPKTPKRK